MPVTYLSENTAQTSTSHPTDKLVKFLKDEFNRFDKEYKVRAKAWSAWHQQFRGVMEKMQTEVTKSRLFINRTKVAVFAAQANILDVLFPGQDFFDIVGREAPDEQGSEKAKALMDWMLSSGNFLSEAAQYVLQAAIYGTTFGKIVMRSVDIPIVDKLPQIDEVLKSVQSYSTHPSKKTYRYAAFENVDIFSFWIDPMATSIENASGMFHKVQRPCAYIKKLSDQGIYHNYEEVEKMLAKNKRNDRDKRRNNVGLPNDVQDKEAVDVYEYWGKVPKDVAEEAGIKVPEGDTDVECICSIVNLDVLIRQEENRHPAQERMFISDVWELSGDNSLYGRGIPENVRGSQMALNATINIRLDNKAWAIAAPIIVNIDKIEDVDDLIARPNWVIRTQGAPNDVAQFVTIPDLTASTPVEAEAFERYIDDESGMNKIVQANQGFGSNRTAHGISLAFSAASRPVRMVARGFEQNLIAKGLKKIFMLFVTNMDKEVVIRVLRDPKAPQYITVDPFSLAMNVDFIPSGSFALTMREAMLESMMSFVDAASKIPPVAQQLNWKYITEKVYQAMGLKDFEKVWLGNPEGGVGLPGQQPGMPPMGEPHPGPTESHLHIHHAPQGAMNGQAPVGAPPQGIPQGGAPIPPAVHALAALGRMARGGGGGNPPPTGRM
jgi:hypothetical protein